LAGDVQTKNGLVLKLETEIVDMRRGIEQLIAESGEVLRSFDSDNTAEDHDKSVLLIVQTLLTRLKEEEALNKKLESDVCELETHLTHTLYAIALDSESLTKRLGSFVAANRDDHKDSFLIDWAHVMTEEIRFLQELRAQRDELFEMKLKSLHKVYSQPQTEEELSVVERCGVMIEALQAELGQAQEALMSKETELLRRDHVVERLTESLRSNEHKTRVLEVELTRFHDYIGVNGDVGKIKKPAEYEQELHALQFVVTALRHEVERDGVARRAAEEKLADSELELKEVRSQYLHTQTGLLEKVEHLERELVTTVELKAKLEEENEENRKGYSKVCIESIDLKEELAVAQKQLTDAKGSTEGLADVLKQKELLCRDLTSRLEEKETKMKRLERVLSGMLLSLIRFGTSKH
jgi:hypothetical protein